MNSILLLTIMNFVIFLARGLTGPSASLFAESLGANYFIIGVLSTLASLTAMASSYVWGRQSDRLGRRKPILALGTLGSALSTGLLTLVPEYRLLFPLHIMIPASEAAYQTASLALMGDLLQRRSGRGRSMGIYRGMGSLGFAIMAFFAGSVADRTSLRIPFAIAAGLYGLAFVLCLLLREAPSSLDASGQPLSRVNADTDSAAPAAMEGRQLSLTPLLVAAFLWSLSFNAIHAVWPNYLVGHLGYTRTAMSRLWSLAALTEVPMMVMAGWLSDRVGRLPVLSLSLLCWTGVFLGYATVPVYPWILVIQLGRGFGMSAFLATAMTYVAEVTSQAERGRASGLYSATGSLGSMLGGTLGGSLTQLAGFQSMILTSTGLVFIGAIYLTGVYARWSTSSRASIRQGGLE